MLTVEDLIDRLACNGKYLFEKPLVRYFVDQNTVDSFSEQLAQGLGLTYKQKMHSLNIIRRYYKVLKDELNVDIDAIINPPNFSTPTRIISNQKTIKIVHAGFSSSKIVVKFPYEDKIVGSIREYKKGLHRSESIMIEWDSSIRCWVFNFNEPNVLFLSKLINHGFIADKEFNDALEKIDEILENHSNYIPHVSYENGKFFLKNVHSSIPNLEWNNPIEALVTARRYGITSWDDTVDSMVTSEDFSNPMREFFQGKLAKNSFNTLSVPLADFSEILKYSGKVLFVIPGGSELEHLTSVCNLLKSIGYSNEEISVLFRLDQKFGKDFNNYVKLASLNNPIDENVRAFFISKKFPRPLEEKNYNFDLVVYFGINAAHYTLRCYLRESINSIKLELITKTGNLFDA